jgi:arsenate reductase-like glutaredoxin family protein
VLEEQGRHRRPRRARRRLHRAPVPRRSADRRRARRRAAALGKEPWEIARTGEAVAADLGLAHLPLDRAAWIEVLVANPVLIERPILVTGDGRAAIGRPLEALTSLL